MFAFETSVKLHDTDAAGLLFFGHQFKIAHDAYESFLESIDCPLSWVVAEAPILLPLVHAEADYLRPLAVGDRLKVELRVSSISRHSFVLAYRLVDQRGELVGTASTVHVAIDKKSRTKTTLPDKLRFGLEQHQS